MTSVQSPEALEVTEALGGSAPIGPAVAPAPGERPAWIAGTLGGLALLVLWEVLAVTVFHRVGSGVPTPTSVVTKLWSDYRKGLYGRNLRQTLKEAALGYTVANVLAIGLAIVFVQLPVVERALLRIAIASYCLPIIAVGPILNAALHGDAPKSALAGLIVFFPTLVGTLVGLRSADGMALDLIRASGGGRWKQLTKVRLRAALPSTFAALKIAAPSAMLGAIIGEYLGNQDHGLGIMMVAAQGGLEIARTWGIAFVLTAAAGIAYLATGVIGRALTPWAPKGGVPR